MLYHVYVTYIRLSEPCYKVFYCLSEVFFFYVSISLDFINFHLLCKCFFTLSQNKSIHTSHCSSLLPPRNHGCHFHLYASLVLFIAVSSGYNILECDLKYLLMFSFDFLSWDCREFNVYVYNLQ